VSVATPGQRQEIVEVVPQAGGAFIRRAYATERNPILIALFVLLPVLMAGAVVLSILVQPILGLGVMIVLIGAFVSASRRVQPFVRGRMVSQDVLEVPNTYVGSAPEVVTPVLLNAQTNQNEGVISMPDAPTVGVVTPPPGPAGGGQPVPVPPTVSVVKPSTGAAVGGQSVRISGKGFTGTTSVLFGVKPAEFNELSDALLVAISPPPDPDSVTIDIVVTTPVGTSPVTPADRFTYLVPAGAWTNWHTTGLVLIVIAMVLIGVLLPSSFGTTQAGSARLWSWFLTLGLLALFLMIAGNGITARWAGLFIDERNKMSLSRLQLVLWTVVVLAGIFAVGIPNIVYGPAVVPPNTTPLAIAIPIQIWAALGISTVALVGSPLVLGTKDNKTPDPAEQASTAGNLAQQEDIPPADIGSKGLIVTKSHPKYASWSDLFKGEETGNADTLDIARVQMFFFTVILVFAYAVAITVSLGAKDLVINQFPAFDQSMVALLAISHAANLTNKVVPHSQEST
jgi:hypothetical protein